MLQSKEAKETTTINDASLLFQSRPAGSHNGPEWCEASVTEFIMKETKVQELCFAGLMLDLATLVEDKDRVEELAAAIEQLPHQERLVVTLYYYEEITLREVGELLNLAKGRVAQIFSQATFRLRQALTGSISILTPGHPATRVS